MIKLSNCLFLISGGSGSGKTTLARSLMTNELTSFTTRAKRTGEIDGKDYIYISNEEFENLLNSNGLVESTEYGGNKYGLTKAELESKLEKGSAFFICDYNGMKQIKNIYDNCVSVFIECSKTDAERNMRYRGDSEEQIKKRLSTYDDELESMIYYDYIITNTYGNFEEAQENLRDIIEGHNGL